MLNALLVDVLTTTASTEGNIAFAWIKGFVADRALALYVFAGVL